MTPHINYRRLAITLWLGALAFILILTFWL